MRRLKLQPRQIVVFLVGLAALTSPISAPAVEFRHEQKTCPLCKAEFQTMEAMSGTSFGTRTDLKPLGPISAPWPIPVCPKCGFVLYDHDIPKGELDKCRTIVASANYKEQSRRASYYLLGLLYEGLKKDELALGHVFLKASWQEEKDQAQLKEDLQLSEKHFAAFLAKAAKHDKLWETAQIVSGEIKRRLKDFDVAKRHFEAMKAMKEFQGNHAEKIIDYQLKLIEKKDSTPHSLAETETSK